MSDITNFLREQTINYLINIKSDTSVDDSSFNQVLITLSDLVLHEDPNKIKSEIEKIHESKKKCTSCGSVLGPFERKVCGPCRLKDPRYKDELDE